MTLRKFFLWAATVCGITTASLSAVEATSVLGAVNFTTCLTDSKLGKKEQEKLENLRKQFVTIMEDKEKERGEIAAKFEDSEYLDGLSPKAEEELRVRYQTINEDLAQYQNQFYQFIQQANMQMVHVLSREISRASEKIADQKHLDYVSNKEACFYCRPELDVTAQVISEMDKNYETEAKAKKLSENDLPLDQAEASEKTAG